MQKPAHPSKSKGAAASATAAAAATGAAAAAGAGAAATPAAAVAGAGAAAATAAPTPTDSTTELCDSETGEPFHVTFSLDSASDRKQLCDFFAANGYVAIRDVLTRTECAATVAEMGADMRARSATATGRGSGAAGAGAGAGDAQQLFDINDVNTYDRAPITSRYGMYTFVPLFTDQLVRNRQHARVFDAMQLLYGVCGHEPEPHHLLVNHDSGCFYRPTLPRMRTTTAAGGVVEEVVPQPTWATGDGKDLRELHLDFHPSGAVQEQWVRAKRDALRYDTTLRDFLGDNNYYVASDGLQLACVLNLVDNRVDDGGFHCVPTFPAVYDEWCAAKFGRFAAPAASAAAAAAGAGAGAAAAKPSAGARGKTAAKHSAAAVAATAGAGTGTGAAVGAGGVGLAPAGVEAGSYHFSDSDKTDMKYIGPRGIVRVNVPAGTLIVWDQRMAHGSRPNMSDRPRMAQFQKWFPKRLFTKERLAARKKALVKALTDSGFLQRVGLTDIGKNVFGW